MEERFKNLRIVVVNHLVWLRKEIETVDNLTAGLEYAREELEKRLDEMEL